MAKTLKAARKKNFKIADCFEVRILFLFFVILIFASLNIFRLYNLQILSREYYLALATRTARVRCRSSPRRAGAAHRASGALPPRRPDPRFPLPRRPLHWRRGKRPAPRGTPKRASPSATVCAPRLPAIGRRGEKVIAPRIAPAAIPLIGVPCLGHEGLPDALPPREP